MVMLRAFIAIEIPVVIQEAIHRETAGLQKALTRPLVRWVAPQNVHLTLKFLGAVSPANLELLAQALTVEASQHDSFSISVGELGVFPSPRRPRVVWIGIEAPTALNALQRMVEAIAARLGYAAEVRSFSPHLTIGRVSQQVSPAEIQKIRAAIEGVKVGILGTTHVNAVHIFKSDLQPTGSVYTHLYAAPLKL